MPIIIDGWNLIRDDRSAVPDDETESIESAIELISRLDAFQDTHSDPIILVFDSSREFLGIKHANSARLTVVPAKDADGYIKRYIERTPERQRRNLRVVSSDNDIYFFAKSYHATPLKSRDFWDKLDGIGAGKKRGRSRGV